MATPAVIAGKHRTHEAFISAAFPWHVLLLVTENAAEFQPQGREHFTGQRAYFNHI